MLYICIARFDVTGNLNFFAKIFGTKQGLRQSQNVRSIVVAYKRSLHIFFLIGIIIGVDEFIWR
jgi:hypothetical protein